MLMVNKNHERVWKGGVISMNMDLDAATKEAPTLTLDPFAEAKAEIVEKKPEELVEEQAVPEMELTPEEQKMVDDFAGQIDLTNTQAVLQYGAGSQKKIADFSETALSNVRTKDMGEVGQLLTDVVAQLKDFDTEEDKGFFGLFKKSGDKLSNLKAKYDKAEVNISKICDAMENHQVVLLKDVAVLDKLYQLNLNYFRELSMYILAGKKKLTQAKNVELPELLEKHRRADCRRIRRLRRILQQCVRDSRRRSMIWNLPEPFLCRWHPRSD